MVFRKNILLQFETIVLETRVTLGLVRIIALEGKHNGRGPDANGVYWTSNLSYGVPIEFNGTDFISYSKSGNTTWTEGNGEYHVSGSIYYIKTLNGSAPGANIYTRGGGIVSGGFNIPVHYF
jgi:hypothetical protein